MTFDEFLSAAWNDHGDRPQEVAERVRASLHLVQTPQQIAPYAALATHVFGEHLGQWENGVAVLDALRRCAAFDGSAAAARSLASKVAALRYAGGDSAALDALSHDERVAALATAASAFTGLGRLAPAISAYREAIALAGAGLPAGSPAARQMAITGNNLACALEEKTDRDAQETQAMLTAAEGGLTYWKLAGTWLEEERAQYRLARSLLQAGRASAALEAAQRCIEVCERNDAPAFERFFGHAVLALAQRAAGDQVGFGASRARALQHYEQVPAGERTWCESDLREL